MCYHLRFFFASRRRHTRLQGDWSSDVCSSDLCCLKHLRSSWNNSSRASALLTGTADALCRSSRDVCDSRRPSHCVVVVGWRSEERRVGNGGGGGRTGGERGVWVMSRDVRTNRE